MLEDPKQLIYSTLSSITGVEVFQIRPEVIADFPCITFYIANNVPVYSLESEIKWQQIEVVIDIWANSSMETRQVLQQVESKMRGIKYLLTFNTDVPEPDPNGYSHLSTKFVY